MAELERSAAPRNGLPEFRPYRYGGTGEDIYRRKAGRPTVARDRPRAALSAVPGPRVPEPAPAPPPVTAASRCGQCGYLTTAAGHRVTCDD